MDFSLSGKNKLNATLFDVSSDTLIIFLAGGNLTIGRQRFLNWQEKLAQSSVSSLSFDYSGVANSGSSLEQSSLALRIEEAACAVNWAKNNLSVNNFILYGVSMGGYIALGLTEKFPSTFNKLILHSPAAYAKAAHEITFGKDFTDCIRKDRSWENSNSFEWLKSYRGETLLIEAARDEIVPVDITRQYKNILQNNDLSKMQTIDTTHNIWSEKNDDINSRETVYNTIKTFISS